ncbi:MAG: cupin domain-containing protein [Bacteroidales bacterium]
MNKLEIIKLDDNEIDLRGIRNWPIWEKGVSRFPYIYLEDEHCLFLEGEVVIETEQDKVTLYPGDYVIFRSGLKCIWTILKPVKKHYHFE